MSTGKKNLFEPVVAPEKRLQGFEYMRTFPSSEPARLMANEVFQGLPDPDGNFVEQFQTTGFDSRTFELYLYAYLSRSGYTVSRHPGHPDFVVNKGGVIVAIEATTVNPTQTKDPASTRNVTDLTSKELQEKLDNELPVRFGGPLFSKLNKRYWEMEMYRRVPIVFAIEAFHEMGSLYYSDNSLGQYLYGLRHYPDWTEDGHLVVRSKAIESHQLGSKVIPSNFFAQPEAEHISAVIFSNSGTHAKFNRMGYQAGYYRGNMQAIRRGACYDPDSEAAKPLEFSYDVDDPPIPETWGQGLVVFHNPHALFPIPRGYFVDTAEQYEKDGQITTDVPAFHPYMSQTVFIPLERTPFDSPAAQKLPVESLLRCEFDALKPAKHPAAAAFAAEKEWFADRQRIILGSLLLLRADRDWAYVVLGRDEVGTFRWIEGEHSIQSRDQARERMLVTMLRILDSGQTIFP